MSSLNSKKSKWLSNEKKSLKALVWLDLAKGYLNLVIKHL